MMASCLVWFHTAHIPLPNSTWREAWREVPVKNCLKIVSKKKAIFNTVWKSEKLGFKGPYIGKNTTCSGKITSRNERQRKINCTFKKMILGQFMLIVTQIMCTHALRCSIAFFKKTLQKSANHNTTLIIYTINYMHVWEGNIYSSDFTNLTF